jgi:hypothetical protein
MTLLVAWLAFPLVLALLALGCGLLVERLTETSLPALLLPGVGLALVIVVADFLTRVDGTAELATPAVLGLAAAGLWLSPRRRNLSVPRLTQAGMGWPVVCGAAVFLAFAAPIALSGQATLAGYLRLEDTSIWLTLVDHVMEHGRDLSGLAPSSYEAILDQILDEGYPVGFLLPLGVARPLVGQDVAWLLQPYMAFLAVMMSLALYSVAGQLVRSRPLRALVAFVASQPALLFAYSLWGGTKELLAAWVLALIAALLPAILKSDVSGRAMLPLAAVCAAAFASLSAGAALWILPLLVPALVVIARGGKSAEVNRNGGAFVALFAALSLPTLVTSIAFFDLGGSTLTSGSVLGNLIEPLSWRQAFGIWPTGDFRLDPQSPALTNTLILAVAAAGVLAFASAWERRAHAFAIFAGGAVVGMVLVAAAGAPWLDAKAFATASPALLLAAMTGAAVLSERWSRAGGLLLAAVVGAGVLWSNALAYREVDLAPYDRFEELADIGERIAGEGPTLMTEYEFYGVRHFLRDGDPEGAALLHRRKVPLATGSELEENQFSDIDAFQLRGLLQYRTVVLRRSPLVSRPPSPFELTWKGRFYEVWQRFPQRGAGTVQHFQFGEVRSPTTLPRCADLRTLAGRARDARFAAVVRSQPVLVSLGEARFSPDQWQELPEDSASLAPRGEATLVAAVPVRERGRYGIWIGGSFRGRLEANVDGIKQGGRTSELNYSPDQYTELGQATLEPGTHKVTLRYGGADLGPGTAGDAIAPFGERVHHPFAIGPLVFSTSTADSPITRLAPAELTSLCGKQIDWLEVIR